MATRRDFLKAGAAAGATGIVFCSCGLLNDAHAQETGRQTLPVMVGGKRVRHPLALSFPRSRCAARCRR